MPFVFVLFMQCVEISKRCDGQWDCATGQDEQCPEHHTSVNITTPAPPAVINFSIPEGFTVTPLLVNNIVCPDTHFLCPGNHYCLPVYLRCNAFRDCPDNKDEADCDNYRCPGFYRCRHNVVEVTICVHVSHLCDGTFHCPLQDDELWCGTSCPGHCICHGTAFTCSRVFNVSDHPQLRYLKAAGSGIQLSNVLQNTMLIHLGVRSCGWMNLTVIPLPNLLSLDLTDNLLHYVDFMVFTQVRHLQKLVLAFNPVRRQFSDSSDQFRLTSLKVLNLSRIPLESINFQNLSAMIPNLEVLDLSYCRLKSLHGRMSFLSLQILDLRGCPPTDFSRDFMKSMDLLIQVYSENFKVCCSAVLPPHFGGKCIAPSDEISSCEALLKSDIYRIALAVFSMLALAGNLGSLTYRFFFSPESTKHSFSVFVTHLCVSDCLMGVYLALIGVADRVYLGSYLWSDFVWKSSVACSIAGFLSLLSSEVSAFLICLITLDRFLVLHFPFSQVRFKKRSSNMACVVMWTLGLILAVTPLLPVTSHWQFYRQTGVCIPLPITRADFAGHSFSFGVMIACNLVMFLLIAVGQVLIYWSVRMNSMCHDHQDRVQYSNDRSIALRLLSIAVTDFLCWFPIGLCGVLASMDVAIPGEVNVAMAIFVLPLNSALNPFIYTLNLIREKRRKAREDRFQRFVTSLLKT